MKRTLLTLSILAMCGAASATVCPAGTPNAGKAEPFWPNHCYDGGTSGDNTSKSAALGVGLGFGQGGNIGAITLTPEQQQQQAQQQRAEAEAKAAADAKAAAQANGTVKATTTQGVSVSVQGAQPGSGSTTTYTDKSRGSVFLPPVLFAPALPPMPGVNGGPIISECGPRQAIYREPAYVLIRNNFGPDTRVQVGWDEFSKDVPEGEPRYKTEQVPSGFAPDGSIIYTTVAWGEQIVIKKEPLSRASSAGVSIGGYGSNLGGQGGASGQAQVQDFVTSISLIPCRLQLRPAVIVEKEIEYRDRPVIKYLPAPKPRTPRPPRVAPCPVVCCVPAAPVCATPAAGLLK